MSREPWEREASNWAAWARRPGFDAYWTYSPTFFALVPPAGTRTLEVGCGEGRVSRDLTARGHRVTSVDGSPTLIRMARDADSNGAYVMSDAGALPFLAESFDLVVFYNSLMDIDDMEGSVREAARVLRAKGALCACVTHPVSDAGRFESNEADAPFVIEGSYLGERRWTDVVEEHDGLRMTFKGWAYSLGDYFIPLERAGFTIQAVREPSMDEAVVKQRPSQQRWRRIPNFLMWRALKA